jgi:hypothetical protein
VADTPFVAIQINGTSFQDEGVEPVLDTLQQRARVNALFLGTPSWTRGIGGRQVPGHPLPDHGPQEYDHDWWGGDYARTRPEYFGGTILGPVPRASEFEGRDLFDEVIPAAKERGIAPYAFLDESSYIQAVRDIPNMPKVLEVDVWNRPSTRMCFNNPDYRNWWLSVVQDYVKNYGLEGLAIISERGGPLNAAVQGSVQPEGLTCFCVHCKTIARERGVDPERAQRGYREILRWNAQAGSGERPSDGVFTTFWRILLNYPEVLAWQSLWTDGQHQFYRDVYGVAKASNQNVQVGWHIYHTISWSPFYRADQDYAAMSEYSDFLKVVAYNNAGGPRFHSFVQSISRAFFGDLSPEETYPVLSRLLDYEEGELGTLPQTGLSADYVQRETARAVRSAGPTKIYTGIDIDIPVGTTPEAVADREKRFEGNMGGNRSGAQQGVNNDSTSGADLASCTPQSVKAAVLGAFAGGASGVVLSRKYSEMMLDNLSGVGAAIDELGR